MPRLGPCPLGIPTELLRVSSRRPIIALMELVHELDAGLLVFGPDRSRLTRRRFRAAERAVRRKASCLVWTSSDYLVPPGPES